jgi:hypothetical protein
MTNPVRLPGTIRVAVMVDSEPGDYGLSTAIEQMCERGVAGYEIDVIGSRGPASTRIAFIRLATRRSRSRPAPARA